MGISSAEGSNDSACPFSPRTSHSSMLMPLRAASSVPWAGLRDRSPAGTNQPHGAAEPSMVLLTSEKKVPGSALFKAFHEGRSFWGELASEGQASAGFVLRTACEPVVGLQEQWAAGSPLQHKP